MTDLENNRYDEIDWRMRVFDSLSFPTLIKGELAVIGEDYDGVKEVLGLK